MLKYAQIRNTARHSRTSSSVNRIPAWINLQMLLYEIQEILENFALLTNCCVCPEAQELSSVDRSGLKYSPFGENGDFAAAFL
jgi:hypothetical protein